MGQAGLVCRELNPCRKTVFDPAAIYLIEAENPNRFTCLIYFNSVESSVVPNLDVVVDSDN